MLLLRPRNTLIKTQIRNQSKPNTEEHSINHQNHNLYVTSLALAASARGVNDVVGSITGVDGVGIVRRSIILRQIRHTSTLPKRVSLRESHAEKHDPVLPGTIAAVDTGARVMAVISAVRARPRHALSYPKRSLTRYCRRLQSHPKTHKI